MVMSMPFQCCNCKKYIVRYNCYEDETEYHCWLAMIEISSALSCLHSCILVYMMRHDIIYPVEAEPSILRDTISWMRTHVFHVFRRARKKIKPFLDSVNFILNIPKSWEQGSRSKEGFVEDMEHICKFAELFDNPDEHSSEQLSNRLKNLFCTVSATGWHMEQK